MVTVRLTCEDFYVDVRVRDFGGRFVASADTPNGPTLGLGVEATDAIERALLPFDGAIEELMESLPRY